MVDAAGGTAGRHPGWIGRCRVCSRAGTSSACSALRKREPLVRILAIRGGGDDTAGAGPVPSRGRSGCAVGICGDQAARLTRPNAERRSASGVVRAVPRRQPGGCFARLFRLAKGGGFGLRPGRSPGGGDPAGAGRAPGWGQAGDICRNQAGWLTRRRAECRSPGSFGRCRACSRAGASSTCSASRPRCRGGSCGDRSACWPPPCPKDLGGSG